MVTEPAQLRLNYYLFARPSFMSGVASVFDFGNTLFIYNDSPTGQAADYLAIKNDWLLVGDDVADAIKDYEAPSEQLELIPSDIGT